MEWGSVVLHLCLAVVFFPPSTSLPFSGISTRLTLQTKNCRLNIPKRNFYLLARSTRWEDETATQSSTSLFRNVIRYINRVTLELYSKKNRCGIYLSFCCAIFALIFASVSLCFALQLHLSLAIKTKHFLSAMIVLSWFSLLHRARSEFHVIPSPDHSFAVEWQRGQSCASHLHDEYSNNRRRR